LLLKQGFEAMTDNNVLEVERGFVTATGIECSAPVIAGGKRMDELEKTGHYEHLEQDLAMVAELGVTYLRYGIPYHRTNPEPGVYDWAFTDRALNTCRTNGLVPIVDLLHFGLPDYIGGFQNRSLPRLFGDYAARFAERYPWVRHYTPVNEPLITARFSARDGMWNERLASDAGFARAIMNVCGAAVHAVEAIRRAVPDAVFIQSDTCEAYHPTHPDARPLADFYNELRFVGFELVFGRRLPDNVQRYLVENGVERPELAWFEAHGSDAGCIAGNDYYATSEKDIEPNGAVRPASRRLGYAQLGRQYHERLQVPLMHSETNMAGPGAVAWLEEQWAEVDRLRQVVPVRGFTWYGFVNHVDWDTELQEDNGRENDCGLVSLARVPNATYAAYQRLIRTAPS
jgi:beta-glucosidase/6-phospho-beta-glucosidase/beta-galactosidase